MTKPTKPTAPAPALRSDPDTFRVRAEDNILFLLSTLPDYADAIADFVDARADEALAAALGGTLPSLAGNALKLIRVNAGGSAAEFFDLENAVQALRALTPASNKLAYYTLSNSAALTDFTSFARTLLDDPDQATMRATLGLVPGTDIEAKTTVSAAVTAGTYAQGQGALTSDVNIVTTAANNPSGVTLPTATAGRSVLVVNRGANAVAVFPASGATITRLSVNAPRMLMPNDHVEFVASAANTWHVSGGENQWMAVASKNDAIDLDVLPVDVTFDPGYDYRIEGRRVSRSDQSGIPITFTIDGGSQVFTLPLGAAASSYDFVVEIPSPANDWAGMANHLVFEAEYTVVVDPGTLNGAIATRSAFISAGTVARPNGTGSCVCTAMSFSWTNIDSGIVTVYRKRIS